MLPDYKAVIIQTLTENNYCMLTDNLIEEVTKKVDSRLSKYTKSNILTDICGLEAWEVVKRNGRGQNEMILLTKKESLVGLLSKVIKG